MLPVWLTDTVTSDLERALHYTLLWGLEGVVLRTVGGPADRVPFVNQAQVEQRLRAAEVLPAAIVPGMFDGEAGDRAVWFNALATFDETLRFCERIGCPRVVVSAFRAGPDAEAAAVDALRRAGAAAQRHGVALAVRNAWGRAHATGAALAGLLAAVNHGCVRAAWSPADALRAGEDPADGLQALEGRVELVRCVDGQGRGSEWERMPAGEGAVGWDEQLVMLRRQGFRGPVSLEVNSEPRPREGLRVATWLIRSIRKVQRAGAAS